VACILQEWLSRDLTLCCFDQAQEGFFAVSAAEVLELFERQARPSPIPALAPGAPARVKAIKKGLRGCLSWLPPYLRPAAADAGHALIHLGKCLARLGGAISRNLLPSSNAGLPRPALAGMATFVGGDVLLSPGGSWEDPSYLAVVRRWQEVGLRLVPLVYDLIPHKFPQFYPCWFPPQFEAWLKDLLGLADSVVTISESSRRDLLGFGKAAQIPLPPLQVIRLGDLLPTHRPAEMPGQLPSFAAGEAFVLSVGTVEIRKNHALLYHVWRRLIEEHGDAVPPLVIAGQRGWLCDELQHQIRLDPLVAGKVIQLEDLHDGELSFLYDHCLFTLFPSHYEGWGLPVCESLAHGKFCIASDRSSLPEIAGNLIDYHDPFDFSACKTLVERALFDSAYRCRREEEIRTHFRQTSWGDCAAELWSILTNVADREARWDESLWKCA
jgi:glycosyltransferase involved in cell wall biosynthesis